MNYLFCLALFLTAVVGPTCAEVLSSVTDEQTPFLPIEQEAEEETSVKADPLEHWLVIQDPNAALPEFRFHVKLRLEAEAFGSPLIFYRPDVSRAPPCPTCVC